jgi:multidrug efflux pump subunit AcrA (membrane-fusion protein)
VHPGSLVGPSGGAVLRIEQVSRLRLTVPVPEAYVGAIKKGTKVEFKVSAFPDETFQGVIARPAHSLDMKTRSMFVELDVANASLALAPGMFAEVQWPVARAKASLFVPTTAVVRTSERQFVVRVLNGVAEWVDVRRGEVNGDVIEVFGRRAISSFAEETTRFARERRLRRWLHRANESASTARDDFTVQLRNLLAQQGKNLAPAWGQRIQRP